LSSHDVKYLVIGGTAAVLYGVPRATFDLDLTIEATLENAGRLIMALRAAGFGTATQIEADELLRYEITIFRDRYRVDVQTATPGIRFDEAWPRRVEMKFDDVAFWVASRGDIIASRRASGRRVDLEDVRILEGQTEDSQ
jgi:hypothetical protein